MSRSFRDLLPSDEITIYVLHYLLPEQLSKIAEIDKASNFLTTQITQNTQDTVYANRLWEAKFALHFHRTYKKILNNLGHTTKNIDWKKLFWKTYKEDCYHIQYELKRYNNNVQSYDNNVLLDTWRIGAVPSQLNLRDLSNNGDGELFKIIKKMFSCVIEGHYKTFNEMLTLLLKYDNPLQLFNITNTNDETLLDCIRANDKSNIMLDAIYQKMVTSSTIIKAYDQYYTYYDYRPYQQRSLFTWAFICRQQAVRDIALREEVIDVKEFFLAAQLGDSDTMSVLIPYLTNKNINIHGIDQYSMTPLYYAAQGGHVEAVKLLLDKHADVSADHLGKTSLHYAALSGNVEMMQVVLNHYPNVGDHINALDRLYFMSPLLYAAYTGHDQTVKFLLDRNANINGFDEYADTNRSDSRTTLHFAAQSGHVKVVTLLLDEKSNVNVTDQLGVTPLHDATQWNHGHTIKFLLNKNADVNAMDKFGETPLHYAAKMDRNEAIKLLLDEKAIVNVTNHLDRTPLHYAAHRGHVEAVTLLLGKHADVSATDQDGRTALSFTGINNHAHIIPLLKNHAVIQFHHACCDGNVRTIQSFLEQRIDIEVRNDKNNTALHLAARSGQVKIVDMLLKNNANFEAKDGKNNTALHLAARSGQVKIVDMLLEKNANIYVINDHGETALDIAKSFASSSNRHAKIVSLLSSLEEHFQKQIKKEVKIYFESDAKHHFFIKKIKTILSIQTDKCDFPSACRSAYTETAKEIIHATANQLPLNEKEDFIHQAMKLSIEYIASENIEGTFEQEVVRRAYNEMLTHKLDHLLNEHKYSIQSKHFQFQFVKIAKTNILELENWDNKKKWHVEISRAKKFILEKERLVEFLRNELTRINNDSTGFINDKTKTGNKKYIIQLHIDRLEKDASEAGSICSREDLEQLMSKLLKNNYFTQSRNFLFTIKSDAAEHFDQIFNLKEKIRVRFG